MPWAWLFIGAMTAAQDPRFYAAVVKMGIDLLLPVILKRMSPEDEARFHQDIAQGGDGIRRRWPGREK